MVAGKGGWGVGGGGSEGRRVRTCGLSAIGTRGGQLLPSSPLSGERVHAEGGRNTPRMGKKEGAEEGTYGRNIARSRLSRKVGKVELETRTA